MLDLGKHKQALSEAYLSSAISSRRYPAVRGNKLNGSIGSRLLAGWAGMTRRRVASATCHIPYAKFAYDDRVYEPSAERPPRTTSSLAAIYFAHNGRKMGRKHCVRGESLIGQQPDILNIQSWPQLYPLLQRAGNSTPQSRSLAQGEQKAYMRIRGRLDSSTLLVQNRTAEGFSHSPHRD
ncbi:hypothetical protein PENSPDRAFT_90999 [Peniophora sp. CONT]|nr:hypothetical protein PENSPDRAFT_90999 [Peniophora sp. CONT]